MTEREFNPDGPIAYFITWTSYGTWLPGDERGWRRKGRGWQPGNELFRKMAAGELKETPFILSVDDRAIVEQTVRNHCEIRGWVPHAVQARTNHVHVVVAAPGYKPDTVRDQFKAWCTRKLKTTHSARERFWTEGGSGRWINHENDLEASVNYVNEAQDSKGLDIQARRASE